MLAAVTQPLSAAERFHPFSLTHAVTLTACIALGATFITLGRRFRGTSREPRLRLAWALFIIIAQAATIAWYLLPRNFDLDRSLPLHVCDLAPWVAVLSMLWTRRWLQTWVFFWGVGLCSQAFITPVVPEGYAHWPFWFFWIQHTQIVAAALYEYLVLGYRPRWRDWLVAVGLTYAYTAAIIPFNLAFNLNYGYVGRATPDVATIIDRLGPWPWRLIWLALIVKAVFAALVLIFGWAEFHRRRGDLENASE